MAKYELNGWRPLKPWVRWFVYAAFIAVIITTIVTIEPGIGPGWTALAILALVITSGCSGYVLADARVAVRLRKRGYARRPLGYALAPFPFTDRDDKPWPYFGDDEPSPAH